MHFSIDLNAEQRIDTDRLHLHKYILEEELSLATSLVERIQTVQYCGCSWDICSFPVPLKETEELRRAFSRRIDTLDRVCDIFVNLQSEIATMLEDYAKNTSAQTTFPNDLKNS